MKEKADRAVPMQSERGRSSVRSGSESRFRPGFPPGPAVGNESPKSDCETGCGSVCAAAFRAAADGGPSALRLHGSD